MARGKRRQEEAVEQNVRMIGDKDQASVAGKVGEAPDIDVAEEDPQGEADYGEEKSAEHGNIREEGLG